MYNSEQIPMEKVYNLHSDMNMNAYQRFIQANMNRKPNVYSDYDIKGFKELRERHYKT